MILRNKTKPTMGPGVHLAKVKHIGYSKDANGEVRATLDGEPAVDIIFINREKEEITATFWYTENSQWIFDALCKAVRIDNSLGNVDVKEAIGQKLWIVVAREETWEDGVIATTMDGSPRTKNVIVPKFFTLISEDSPPAIEGDPKRHDGIPSGIFLKKRELLKKEENG